MDSSNPKITKVPVYTPFGYGHIETTASIASDARLDLLKPPENFFAESDKQGDGSIKVFLKSGIVAYIQKERISVQIKINVKTFHGKRNIISNTFDIVETIESLKNTIIKLDTQNELNNFHFIRLIYPIGKIVEVPSSSTIFSLNLPSDSTLLLVGQKSFCWDSSAKGSDITLSNNLLTAAKKTVADYETVLGTVAFTSGRHYWEIIIDSFVDLEDIIIGITIHEANLYLKPGDHSVYWGYLCCSGKKLSPCREDGFISDYGELSKTGDIIGVLLEFDKSECSLSFYRNKKSLGVAFNNIPLGKYYPSATLYYSGVQVTLNTNVSVPVCNS